MKIASSLQAAYKYTKPRVEPEKGVDTSGDSAELTAGPGVIAGGVQGYLLEGPAGAAGGVVGGYLGAKVAKTHNMAVGAATGFGVGALTTTAVTAGLTAALGSGLNPTQLAVSAIGGGLAGLSGTLVSTPGGAGLMSGGIQGFMGNRMSGMAAGTLGGYVGLEVGKKTGSTGAAVAAGTAAGAAIGAGATAGLVSAFGGDLSTLMVAGSAVLGGLAGAVATVSSSRRSAPRDGAYGAMLLGMGAGSYIGNPSMGLASAAAGGFAARAKTNVGKAVFGVAGGALTGAIVGGLQGPEAILSGAIAGAVTAPLGAIVGTTTRQVMRNAQVDLVNGINKKFVDPYLEKNELTKTQKLAMGAAAGALMLGPIGMVAHDWRGPAVMGTLGAVAGVVQVDRMIAKAKEIRGAEKRVYDYSQPGLFYDVAKAQKEIAQAAKA